MVKVVRIALFALFIINKIRELRLSLDISQRDISKVMSPLTETNLLSNIEGASRTNTYSDEDLILIAIYFTLKAKEIQKELDQDPDNTLKIKTEYTIHDFFPPEPVEDKKVDKIIFPLPPGIGPAGTLHSLLETDSWFIVFHTVREITDYCNAQSKMDWPPGNFSGLCYRLWKKEKFLRLEEGDNDILYKKREVSKGED